MPEVIQKTTCGILTPTGRGAVAVIGVFGPAAANVVQSLFVSASGANLATDRVRKKLGARGQTIFYGSWASTGEDVVVVRRDDQGFEIHCHGGDWAPASIVQSLKQQGVETSVGMEFVQQLHKSRWKAELAQAMSMALTDRTAKILLGQYTIADQQQAAMETLCKRQPEQAVSRLEESMGWANFGQHLTKPWSVVFCGSPNVGKSSLMNALVGFNRAIVHSVAGTTRDVVSHVTAVEGWPVELKDTAGLREIIETENPIETIGIGLTKTEIENADLVVVVYDAAAPWEDFDQSLLGLNPGIVVLNKIDLNESSACLFPSSESELSFSKQLPGTVLRTSASEAIGIEELVHAIAGKLVDCVPGQDVLIPVTDGQVERLKAMLKGCV